MATRASIVFAAMVACIGLSAAEALTLQSQRHDVSVSVTPISGFGGPAYRAWASYDLFSFGHGERPAACYLQVRFARYPGEPADRHSAEDIAIHWNTTPL